ncbi:MAG: DNA replication/repair protein RecF [Myxococcales bacterium]|nr:DNA replication/repair protein RecF [Myxococcales bacterium]MCB9642401.1 DNA replication/repair protein RecF [Myxococcales bacterium]
MTLHLAQFATHHFRNLAHDPVPLHPRFNFFCGENGQGKTNLLEAIYYLFTLRPLRQVRPADLLAWGEPQATLKGELCGRVERVLSVQFGRQKRELFLNGGPPLSLDDYFSELQIVAFTPEEIQLVRGAPSLRRRFLDRAVFNTDLQYLREVRQYLKLLNHRNALLKSNSPDKALLDVLAEQFAQVAARLIRRRLLLLESLRPHLYDAYYRIFPDLSVEIDVNYQSSMGSLPVCPPQLTPDAVRAFELELFEQMMSHLQKNRQRELDRRITLAGPHLDDLDFSFAGRPFKQVASQGQTRALVLALKIAEISEIKMRTGEHPLLLLDDVAGELDPRHSGKFFEFLEETDGQVLLSTTSLAYIQLPDIQRYPCFTLTQGQVLPS